MKLLDDVAAATAARAGHDHPGVDASILRSAVDAPLVERFVRAATEAELRVARSRSDDLLGCVRGVLGDSPLEGPILLEPDLAERRPALRGLEGCLTEPDEDALFSASTGIVGGEAGLAETGSVVRTSGPGRPRSFALVPPRVLLVLPMSAIVTDLYDWLAGRDPGQMPANAVFITGPSKTSDIGMKLVTGVHGPGVVHVILVDEAPKPA